MPRRSIRIFGVGLAVCLSGVVAGAGTAASQGPRPVVCGELPVPLRSSCGGVGVTCTPLSDSHKRWEAVYATEPTRAKAKLWARRVEAKGVGPFHIEQDTRCSNGKGVYEVSKARFLSHAAAAALVAKLLGLGFPHARTEDS